MICGRKVFYTYRPREIDCKVHGRVQEEIPWAAPHAQGTYRLEYVLLVHCTVMTLKAAAQLLKMAPSTMLDLFTSGGAFFELGEAYLNFGILGAFITPFLFSACVSFAMKKFLVSPYSIKSSIYLISILSVLIRGLWYQNFVLYKAFITSIIILFHFVFS
jgi:hypothetical protein